MNKPQLQVCIIHNGVKTYWVQRDDKVFGTQRYYHPDCEIFFQGSRSAKSDHAVMIALQYANMPVRALYYHKGGKNG